MDGIDAEKSYPRPTILKALGHQIVPRRSLELDVDAVLCRHRDGSPGLFLFLCLGPSGRPLLLQLSAVRLAVSLGHILCATSSRCREFPGFLCIAQKDMGMLCSHAILPPCRSLVGRASFLKHLLEQRRGHGCPVGENRLLDRVVASLGDLGVAERFGHSG